MANDFFGGLGGLMKGLTNFMPDDDPNAKVLKTTSALQELQTDEARILGEIGQKILPELGGRADFDSLVTELKIVREKMAKAQEELSAAKSAKEQTAKEAAAAQAQARCPVCGYDNAPGTKFCQDCGGKLGGDKTFCTSCGAQNPPGTRFCGECGARVG